MSAGSNSRKQWLIPMLIVVLGWTLLAAYAVPAYLRQVPALEPPPDGIQLAWVDSGGMKLRVAEARWEFRRDFPLKLTPDRDAKAKPGYAEAFVSRNSRWFHALAGGSVPWNGANIPVVGWATPPKQWHDVDVWIVGPLVSAD